MHLYILFINMFSTATMPLSRNAEWRSHRGIKPYKAHVSRCWGRCSYSNLDKSYMGRENSSLSTIRPWNGRTFRGKTIQVKSSILFLKLRFFNTHNSFQANGGCSSQCLVSCPTWCPDAITTVCLLFFLSGESCRFNTIDFGFILSNGFVGRRSRRANVHYYKCPGSGSYHLLTTTGLSAVSKT
jgi:hypothetical protein